MSEFVVLEPAPEKFAKFGLVAGRLQMTVRGELADCLPTEGRLIVSMRLRRYLEDKRVPRLEYQAVLLHDPGGKKIDAEYVSVEAPLVDALRPVEKKIGIYRMVDMLLVRRSLAEDLVEEGFTGRRVPIGLMRDAWRRLAKNRMAVACGVIFVAICLFSFVGPLLAHAIAGLDGKAQNIALGASPPSHIHWMGTDTLGRDLLVRTMDGGRIAISIGIVATSVSLVIGVAIGSIAGWVGGRTDEVIMRAVDVMYALPSTVFVIVIMAVVSSKSLVLLFALLGAISWLTMARIVRGQVMSLRHREFVEAARGLGVPTTRILFRHVLPNTLGPIIVYATLSVPGVMLSEAFLSFLGLGVQAPRASWGTLVAEGAQQMLYPWLLVGPGLVMGVTIFALNFLGDGLRDAFDPQARKA